MTGAAAWEGSFGMQALIDNNTSIYVSDDRPAAETHYRANFYFDINTLTMADLNAFYIFYASNTVPSVTSRIEVRIMDHKYQLRASLMNDLGNWTSSSWITISDNVHLIVIDWKAATAPKQNNGYLNLWIDHVKAAAITGIDNDTQRVDTVQLGVIAGVDSGTRGTIYFDAFESVRKDYQTFIPVTLR